MKEIQEHIENDDIVYGKEETIKGLKDKSLKKVFVSRNMDSSTMEDLRYYSKIGDVSLERSDMTNKELGNMCQKSFAVSVIGVKE